MTFHGRKYHLVKYNHWSEGRHAYQAGPFYCVYRTCTKKGQFGMHIYKDKAPYTSLKDALMDMCKHFEDNKNNPAVYTNY